MSRDSHRRVLLENRLLRQRVATLEHYCARYKEAEQAAKRSEERYRRLLDSVTDYIFTVTVQNGVAERTVHGKGCLEVTGYSAEEYAENPFLWLGMVPEEDRPAVVAQAQTVLAGGESSAIEHRIIHKDGSIRFVRNTPVVHRDTHGAVVSYDGVIIDVTETKLAEAEIARLSMHDALTGLPNRILFMDRLRQALVIAARRSEALAVYFIDLDHFKEVNDRFGHDVGDAVLVATAERLAGCVRRSDTVARLGGDEFVGLTPAIGNAQHACAIAEKMVRAVREPFFVLEKTCHLGASVGVVLYPDHGTSGEELLRLADTAMYEAKRSGRNVWKLAETTAPD